MPVWRKVAIGLAGLWAAGILAGWTVDVLGGDPPTRYFWAGPRYHVVVGTAALVGAWIGAWGLRRHPRIAVAAGLLGVAGFCAHSIRVWRVEWDAAAWSGRLFLEILPRFLTGWALGLAAAGWGSLAAVPLRRDGFLWSLGLGLAAFGSFTFAMGLLGAISPAATGGFLAAGLALAWRRRRAWSAEAVRGWDAIRGAGGWVFFLQAPLLIALVFGLIRTLAPETNDDGLRYHAHYASIYAQEHRIFFRPDMLYSLLPSLGDFVTTGAFPLGGDGVGRSLFLLSFVATLATTWRLAARAGGPVAGWAAAALYGASAAVRTELGSTMSESVYLLWAALSLDALWDRADGSGRKWAAAGLMAGAVAASKVTATVFPASWALSLLLFRRASPRGILVMAASALAVALPWYARAAAETGNPVWPMASGVFGDEEARLLDRRILGLMRAHDPPSGLPAVWRVPWEATFHGRDFETAVEPFVLGLLPLLLLRRRHPEAGTAALASGIAVVLFSQVLFLTRYFQPLLLGMAAVLGTDLAGSLGGRWRWAVPAGLASVWILTASLFFPAADDAVPVAAGIEPADRYLARHLPAYPAIRRCARTLGPEDRLYFTLPVGPYYLGRWCLPSWQNFQGAVNYERETTPEAVARRLRELGITHILLGPPCEAPIYRNYPVEREVAERYGDVVWVDGEYRLVALRRPPP